MIEVKLKDFEKKIIIRTMEMEDFKDLVEMQIKCFPNMKPWKKEQIESQLSTFPEGQIVVEYEGKVVASSSSLILDLDLYVYEYEWKAFTDNGYIRNHNPKGDTLYGVEIMVDPAYRGMKLARRLYEARKKIAVEKNLRRIIIGGRIPGYAEHSSQMSARQYVDRVMQKALVDPVLTVQIANGFVLKRLIPEYMAGDKESSGYATLLEWTNLDYVHDGQASRATRGTARVCIAQMQMREVASFEEFGKFCEFFADAASEYKSDFLIFPEGLTTQLLSLIQFERPGLGMRNLSDYTSQYLELFTNLAVKYNVNIIGGTHLSLENERLYNIAYLFRRDGTLGKQAKLQAAPDEVRWWGLVAGNEVEVFETDCGSIAIQIGADIEFPEAARLAVDRGARIIFVPFAVEEPYANLRIRNCAQARAIENHVYVITAGMVGIIPKTKHFDIRYAQSGFYTPSNITQMRGDLPSQCPANVETIMFEELDFNSLRRGRQSEIALNSEKRRRELFPLKESLELTLQGDG